MSQRKLGCSIVLVLLLLLSLLFNFAFLFGGAKHGLPEFDESLVERGKGEDKVALLHLGGIIGSSFEGALGDSMVEDLKIALRQALADDAVKAIVLHIDSPGGEVTASDTIYQAVRQAREKKPIVVYMGSLAASGGYYVACGGSHLMASETTITGSIGVIVSGLRYDELLGKIGVRFLTFKSGKFKDMLSGSRAMTPEEEQLINDLVMQTYDRFLGIVAKERGVPAEQLRSTVADGRIITGRDAVSHKLIDATGQLEDAFKKARELGRAPDASVVKYQAAFRLDRLLHVMQESSREKLQIKLDERILPRLEPGRLYFLPSFYAP